MVTASDVDTIVELRTVSEMLDRRARRWAAEDPLEEGLRWALDQLRQRLPVGLSKTQAAAQLDVTDETIAAWIRRGVLRTVRIPPSPKEWVDASVVADARERIGRFRELGVEDKVSWGKLLGAGIGEDGSPFTDEELEIIDLNRTSRGIGLHLPPPRPRRQSHPTDTRSTSRAPAGAVALHRPA